MNWTSTLALIRAVPIFVFVASSPLLVRLQLPRLNTLLTRPVRRRRSDPDYVAGTVQLVDLAIRCFHRIVPSTCLTRGLTLYWFLRRLGTNVDLVFGAGHLSERFAGHCWLELNCEPYLEKVDPRRYFHEVCRFPM